MTNLEISSIIASCVSIVLAIVAIALSIIFFRMSSLLSESTKEASKSISAGVERLEKLFDRLYADTFSMMKETYSDMRKHIWPEESTGTDKITEEAEIKTEKKVSLLKSEINKELSKMFRKQEITDTKLSSIRGEMQNLIDKAISGSRRLEIEALGETVRREIRRLIKSRPKISAETIVDKLRMVFSSDRVVNEIREMEREGKVSFSTRSLNADTIIKLL